MRLNGYSKQTESSRCSVATKARTCALPALRIRLEEKPKLELDMKMTAAAALALLALCASSASAKGVCFRQNDVAGIQPINELTLVVNTAKKDYAVSTTPCTNLINGYTIAFEEADLSAADGKICANDRVQLLDSNGFLVQSCLILDISLTRPSR